jgi:hypothetical protein
MNKLTIISCSFVCLFLTAVTGCSGADEQTSEIKGKFLFDSIRDKPSVFISENGKTKLLLKDSISPSWSPDGKRIACSGSEKDPKKCGILIMDAKGNKKEFITIPPEFTIPVHFNWSPDGTKIYYVPSAQRKKLGSKNKVYCYDFLSRTHTKIIELDESFVISRLALSPKGDKFLVTGSIKNSSFVYLSNSDGANLKVLQQYGLNSAWYHDNVHIGYIGYTDEDRKMPDSENWGHFFKKNVDTGEVEQLQPCKTPFLLELNMSRDGKCYYYTAAAAEGGRVIYVSPIDNPDKKIQITHSVRLPWGGRSQDWAPDWYQGN